MLYKVLLFASFLIASFGASAMAQTRLSYCDTTGPFIDFATTILTPGDTGIIGFAERFDLPSGMHVLDSVDFVIDSIGADSSIIDIVSSNGPGSLPDFSDPQIETRIYTSTKFMSGSRTTVSCGKLRVGNSFFVLLIGNHGSNKYRASKRTTAVRLDTARAAFVAISLSPPGTPGYLIDGNLVPSNMNVDMDIGVTYENSDEVQVHRSVFASAVPAFPNPATSNITIPGLGRVVSIRDPLGRNYDVNRQEDVIDVRSLQHGVYFIMDETRRVKFVKE